MSQSDADWKEQDHSALDWGTVVVAVALAVVYLQLGRASGRGTYFAVAGALLVWVVVFFTGYWDPILYVPAAVLTTSITVFWFVIGSWEEALHQTAALLNVVFLAITSYLVIYEDPVL